MTRSKRNIKIKTTVLSAEGLFKNVMFNISFIIFPIIKEACIDHDLIFINSDSKWGGGGGKAL